jgi:endonuclease G
MAYDIGFLGNGVEAPLPTFGPELAGDIVRSSHLRDEIYADYPTFSLVMNSRHRSAAFVALNIDQSRLGGTGSKSWTFDTRVANNLQLNNDYYRQNVWDRGHMARRASAAWGSNQAQRNRNSRETYYWTNAALQHQWVNQDEWLGVEEWVRTLEDDQNNRVCSISGPIYSEIHTSVEPNGRTPAAVPNAFFKVVMFRHRDSQDQLSVRAFIVPQNAATMRANGEFEGEDLQTYQVPIRLIEQQTGLVFPDEVVQANPLFFEDLDGAAGVGNPDLPEVHEVDVDVNIIDPGQPRPPQGQGSESIRIAAAMVNPSGPERANEWVSLINVGATTVSVQNWELTDHLGRVCHLQGDIEPGVAIRVQPVEDMQLRNRNGSITLTNSNGERVDRAFWIEAETRQQDVPVVFMDPQRFEGPPPQ